MRYVDFVDLSYQPSETDVICKFHVEPKGVSLKEAIGGVAAESSIGTWTELTTVKPYVEKLSPLFDYKGTTLTTIGFKWILDGKIRMIFSIVPGESGFLHLFIYNIATQTSY